METEDRTANTLIDRVTEAQCRRCNALIDVSDFEPFQEVECPHCGEQTVVPGRLGDFLLLELIGAGGMGGVYRGIDESLGRPVAIKVMLPSLGEDKEFVEAFKREARAAAKLNHPHIAQIYSFGQVKGQPYIVMELVPGRGLDKLIESERKLDQGLILKIGCDIAEGLSEADAIGLQHGDIKPENILLDDRMNGKLVDFGIASVAGQAESQEGIWGTPYYIAPEKIRRQKTDARSDIYCLGATLYHALAGTPPFDGKTPLDVVKARLEREPPPLRNVRPEIDESIERIIARMLKRDPAERYPTYASLISDMHKTLRDVRPRSSRRTKRIVVKKRGGQVIRTPTSAGTPASTAATGGTGPAGRSAETSTPEQRARRKKVLIRVFWVFFTLALLGAGVVGAVFYKISVDRKLAARRREITLTGSRDEGRQIVRKMRGTVSNIVARVEETDTMVGRATNAMAVVTGHAGADLLPLLEPPALEPLPPEGTGAVDRAAAPAAGDGAEVEEADEDAEENAPDGDGTAGAEDESADGGATNETAEAAAAAAPPDEDAPVRAAARALFEQIAGLRGMAAEATNLLAEAERLQTELMAETGIEDAADAVMALARQRESLQGVAARVNEALDDAAETAAEIEELRTTFEEEKAAAEQARKEQERREREAAEKVRREAELRARVRRELAAAEELRTIVVRAARNNEFLRPLRTLQNRREAMETQEGRAAVQVLIDQTRRIESLISFLAGQLAKKPFKWGWIQSGSPQDILSATPRHVQLRSGLVPWSEVGVRQMLHLVRNYVDNRNRDVTLSQLAEQALNAAVYCYVNGGYDAAESFARQAVNFKGRLEEDAERLLPPRPEEEEEDGGGPADQEPPDAGAPGSI